MHELPLVFFTVLGQSAAGLFLLAFVSYCLKLSDWEQLKRANLLAFVLMAVGLACSTFHLGQLFRMFNMLAGVGRSPMSNEIVLGGTFIGLAFCTLFFFYVKKSAALATLFNVLTIVAGLAFVWSMTQVYQLATVGSWNTPHTAWQMWMTVLVGGGACALLAGVRKVGGFALLVGAILSLLAKPGYLSFVTEASPALSGAQTTLWAVQAVFLALGIAAAAVALVKSESAKAALALCACGVVVGELLSRIAFYNLWAVAL